MYLFSVMLEAPPMPSDLKSYRKVRSYFASCMAEGDDLVRHRSGIFKFSSSDFMVLIRQFTVKKVIEELDIIASPSEWNQSTWNLTDLLARMIQVNAAPLFDIAVQVDDRNTSRYVLNLALPRQSAILPQFFASVPKDLLHLVSEKRDAKRRVKRQFNFGEFGDHQELPSDGALLEALGLASFDDENKAGGFLPDADFAHSIQVPSLR